MENIYFYSLKASVMPSVWDLHSITDLLALLVSVGQQLVCSFTRMATSFPLTSLILNQACVKLQNEEQQLMSPSGHEFGHCIWLFTLPGRRDGQRCGTNGLAGNWQKLGNKEVWQRGMHIGHSEGAENIKIFVFHVNAQEGLTIKQDKSPCGWQSDFL